MKHTRSRLLISALAALCLLTVCACSSSRSQKVRQPRPASARQQERAAQESMRLYERGRKAQDDQKIAEAARFYSLAVNADQANIYALMALGQTELLRERYYPAAEAFHRASRLAPSRYEPRYNLASVLEAAGRYTDAIREYEAALRLAPDQVEVMENLARTYVAAGTNLERARELAERALEREERAEWRQWLRRQTLRLPGPITTTARARQED